VWPWQNEALPLAVGEAVWTIHVRNPNLHVPFHSEMGFNTTDRNKKTYGNVFGGSS